ncbi:MAG: biopolymer transporter ExbD [Candidatus Abyssubacteria bacterium]
MDLSDKLPKKHARIEIVPLIDCMFLLLVFFVYSMMTLTQPRGIPVKLPPAQAATAVEETFLSISITGEDEVYLDKENVSLDMLASRLADAHSANPLLRVSIKGDADAHHGTVVRVLDILRTLSIERVAIQTAPAESGTTMEK